MRRKISTVLLLALVMFLLLPLSVHAATISDEGWSHTSSGNGSVSRSNGKIELSATGYKSFLWSQTRTASITLTNGTGVKQVLSGNLKFSGDFGSYTFTLPNGETKTGETDYIYSENITIEDGGTLTISITSPSGSGTIKCEYEPEVIQSVSKLITCNTASNGSYSINDQDITADNTSISFDIGDTFTIKATPDAGYVCLGFLIDGTTLLPMNSSGDMDWTPTDSYTITPVFGQVSTGSAPFMVNGKNYYTWETAFAAAGSSGTVILIENEFTLPTTYAANGMTGAGNYVTGKDGALTYSVKAGQTLLLPYSNGDTTVQGAASSGNSYLAHANYTHPGYNAEKGTYSNPDGQQAPDSNVIHTLTVPEDVTVSIEDGTDTSVGNCGRIVVGGQTAFGNGTTTFVGATYKDHSNLVINGKLDLGDYAILSTTGYVLGSGEIVAEGAGAQIYQPYVVMDFPGASVAALAMREGFWGTARTVSGEEKFSPYIYWGVVNIQTDIKMKAGNFMYAHCVLGDDSKPYYTEAVLVGDSSTTGLLVLDSGATMYNHFESITWSGYSYGLLGQNQIRLEGGASMGSLQLSLDKGGLSGTINTADVAVGIGYNINITLEDGAYYIDNSIMLLPGAGLTVAENASLSIGTKASSDIRFAVWDGLIHRGYRSTMGFSRAEYTIAWKEERYNKVNYPTNVELDRGGLSEDAEFLIDGQLNIGSKTAIGGIIQSNGGGVVAVDSLATTSVKVQSNVLDVQSINLQYRAMAAMSLFDSVAKLNVGGALTSISAGTIYYGTVNNALTNSNFTNIYYPGFDASGTTIASESLAITYNTAETIKGKWTTIPPVQIMSGSDAVKGYATLKAAMADYPNVTDDKPYIQINPDALKSLNIDVLSGDAVMLSDVYLDLNGCTVSGDITGKYTLYGFDSGTNGYTSGGSITGAISNYSDVNPLDRGPNAGKNYVAVKTSNVLAFPRVGVAVTGIGYTIDGNYLTFQNTCRVPTVYKEKLSDMGFIFNGDNNTETWFEDKPTNGAEVTDLAGTFYRAHYTMPYEKVTSVQAKAKFGSDASVVTSDGPTAQQLTEAYQRFEAGGSV